MAQVMKPVGEEIKAADGSGGSGSSDAAGVGHITIDLIKKTDGDSDFKLGRFLEEPDSHKFRCPNCNACIENINVVSRGQPGSIIINPGGPQEPITCASCCSFLVFIGILLSHPCLMVTLASAYLRESCKHAVFTKYK
ncbi:hypothetical protein AAG906_038873 [Vitis piasezkii]